MNTTPHPPTPSPSEGGGETIPPSEDTSFESVYNQLELAVSRLETGGLGLEESIGLYEAGMRLARRCKEMLDAAELRVTELEQELSSSVTELALDDEEAD